MDELKERIRLAIKFNDVNEIEKALVEITNPNMVVNSLGQTPLMMAVMKGSLPIVELLLEAGSNPNAQDYTGTTALMLIWDCDLEITKVLIEAGADQQLRNKDGETALDIAKRKKQRKIMALLGFNRLPAGLFVSR
jgi:ankyrin repeat protein